MNCSKCSSSILPSDRFCEQCGAPLVTTGMSAESKGCQKCGFMEIDPEGYCLNCGFGNQRATGRLEKTKNPYLAGVSDRGLCHHQNEDFFELLEIDSNTVILVVCDGVSSSQTPELASRTVAETIIQVSRKMIEQGDSAEKALKVAFASSLESLCNLPYQKNETLEPPSTTVVVCIVQKAIATIGSLGDSRAYWISSEGSCQLTKDDSWLTDMLESGQMSEAEALKSPLTHAITGWLGADAKEDTEPRIVFYPIESPGYLILCTDGLWNYAPKAEDLCCLAYQNLNPDASSISHSLVEFALSKGGHDNVTVAIWSTLNTI